GIEKATPHDRLQETDFPTLLSRLGDIALDEVQGGKAPPPRLERLRVGLAVSFPRKGDIVRDEIPLAFLQHRSEPPREEEIISVERVDVRRSAGLDGVVAGSRRPPVLLHTNDTQTARPGIPSHRRARRVLAGAVTDHDHRVNSRLPRGRAYGHSNC